MPIPKYNWLSYKGSLLIPEVVRWMNLQLEKIAREIRGPVGFDAGNSGTAVTLALKTGHLVLLTLTGNVTITLSTEEVAGQSAYLELTQDAVGSRTVGWVNATGTGSAVAAPTATAGKKTMYLCVYNGTSWVLTVLASNY